MTPKTDTQLDRLERLELLAREVAKMRASQRAFFETHARIHLVEAKRLETLCDRELVALGVVEHAQAALPWGEDQG